MHSSSRLAPGKESLGDTCPYHFFHMHGHGEIVEVVEVNMCQNFLQYDQLEQYVPRYLVYSLIWSFSGDGKMKSRAEMGNFIRSITTIPLPSGNIPIIDYEVSTRLAVEL